jgi:hypothetical protein
MLADGGGVGYWKAKAAASKPVPQYVERNRTLNPPRRRSSTRRRTSSAPRHYSSSNRGYSPPGGGYGRSSGGGGGGGGVRRAAPPPKPKYSGPPPPSAQMIAQLYSQLGEIGRQGKQYKADYTRGVGGLKSARTLFLQQLADAYKGRSTETAADFAARGLSQSGLLTEAMANLNKQRGQEQAGYQAEYQGNLDQLLARLTNQRAELGRRRRTLSERYNTARADRARILKLMGA